MDLFGPQTTEGGEQPQNDTFGPIRAQWDDFLADPQGRAALASFGVQLMQPPQWGQGVAGQVGSALWQAGASATATQAQDLKEQEAASRAALREAQVGKAESAATTAAGRLENQRVALDLKKVQMELADENKKRALEQTERKNYDAYVEKTRKRNESGALVGTPQEPVYGVDDWLRRGKPSGDVAPIAGTVREPGVGVTPILGRTATDPKTGQKLQLMSDGSFTPYVEPVKKSGGWWPFGSK
jgi:hypothetical protein